MVQRLTLRRHNPYSTPRNRVRTFAKIWFSSHSKHLFLVVLKHLVAVLFITIFTSVQRVFTAQIATHLCLAYAFFLISLVGYSSVFSFSYLYRFPASFVVKCPASPRRTEKSHALMVETAATSAFATSLYFTGLFLFLFDSLLQICS